MEILSTARPLALRIADVTLPEHGGAAHFLKYVDSARSRSVRGTSWRSPGNETRCRPLLKRPPRRTELVDGVTAELLEGRVSEDERHHRFADDRGGGHRAHVTPLDGCGARCHRGQVDRSERFHERRDRF